MPSQRFTPRSIATRFARLAATADAKVLVVARACAANGKRHVQKVIGDESKLQPLQPATAAEKEHRGYQYPDAPLYATGDMERSFVSEAKLTSYGAESGFGTEDPKMFWHELGTPRIPARPAVAIAAHESREENFAMFLDGARSIMTGAVLALGRIAKESTIPQPPPRPR